MVSPDVGYIGYVLLVLGVILLLASIAPSSMKSGLRTVGGALAIIGAIIVVVLAVLRP